MMSYLSFALATPDFGVYFVADFDWISTLILDLFRWHFVSVLGWVE
jgi:hypothetical protein